MDTGTALQYPANNNMSAPTVDGYVSLTSNLIEFAELGEIPINIDIARLNDGDGIETTMRRHTARWHKACHLKVNQTKLKRLQHSMKSKNVKADGPSPIATRTTHKKVDLTKDICFLCNEPAGSKNLHRACTHDIDIRVRKCAMQLQDTDLSVGHEQEKLDENEWVSWSAWPANMQNIVITVAMIKHSMTLVQAIVQYLNPGQVPVLAEVLTLEKWCEIRSQESVQFSYWHKTLTLEITLLLLIRFLREGNFQLYVESLTKIVPRMFVLNHTHYSRWFPVHIRDMMQLSDKHPAILAEFEAGKFTVNKTRNKFSAIVLDHCHKQNNAIVKQSRGAIGLTTNSSALRRWMVAGPEVARMVTELEKCVMGTQASVGDHSHHEQCASVQTAFISEVASLTAVLEEMGNPFLEKSDDLLVLDTRDIMDRSVGDTVRRAETLGIQQYKKFIKERLTECTVPITELLSKNKLALFSSKQARTQSKQKMQINALKNDCNLFSRLYIACQMRYGDLDTFFKHENQNSPPSLSLGGKLRFGTKAHLLHCIQFEEIQDMNGPVVNVKLFDGAAVVQMLRPGLTKTFQEYADTIFMPYISSQLKSVKRVDIVWDMYIQDRLKSTTRQKRGKGVRRRVAPTTTIPHNWKDFLGLDENKSELFSFLAQCVRSLSTEEGKCVYTTHECNVLSSVVDADMTYLAPCSHEEADTRLLLHAADAVQKGFRKVCIRTVDTDVVVLAVAMFDRIDPG